jgi:hypothetical protein
MAGSLWVARLIVSDATARKLAAKHDLDWREVRDAIVCTRQLRYGWHHHPERGWRVLVEIVVGGTRCIAVLYPLEEGDGEVFALGSAYPQSKGASW